MPLFGSPTAADRAALLAEYRDRAELVRRDGWGPHRSVWSSGEVTVTEAVLGWADQAGVTEACEAIAPSLWGLAGAEADAAMGYPKTYAWLWEVAGR